MAGPSAVIHATNILRALAIKGAHTITNNKFAAGTVALSLGVPKVVDILGGDSELEEYIEMQLADGMTTSDKTEAKKSINFIGNMFKDGVWAQPLKDGQQHRYLIIDFREDSAVLVVNRNQYSAINKARMKEREIQQNKSYRKKK